MYANDIETLSDEHNLFKKAEKHFKNKKIKNMQYDNLIDLNNKNIWEYKDITKKELVINDKKYDCFEFKNNFFVIKKYLQLNDVLEICYDALNYYINPPNRNNLYTFSDDYDFEPFTETEKYYFNKKIRWANLGRQYIWNERRYLVQKDKDNAEYSNLTYETEIPGYLINHCKAISSALLIDNYNPEAVIVNYYDKKNSMSGHLDDGENDQTMPIISFSMGLSSVFLIGGKSKTEKPEAILLESGDVAIMAGESRRCYHGVPKIFDNTFNPLSTNNTVEDLTSKLKSIPLKDIKKPGNKNNYNNCYNYLSENRLNINLRQVEIIN